VIAKPVNVPNACFKSTVSRSADSQKKNLKIHQMKRNAHKTFWVMSLMPF